MSGAYDFYYTGTLQYYCGKRLHLFFPSGRQDWQNGFYEEIDKPVISTGNFVQNPEVRTLPILWENIVLWHILVYFFNDLLY